MNRIDMEKEAGLKDIWQGLKRIGSKFFGKGTTGRKVAVGTAAFGSGGVAVRAIGKKIKKVRSEREMFDDFRSRTFQERLAILAKLRSIKSDATKSKVEKRKAEILLKKLGSRA